MSMYILVKINNITLYYIYFYTLSKFCFPTCKFIKVQYYPHCIIFEWQFFSSNAAMLFEHALGLNYVVIFVFGHIYLRPLNM